MKINQIKNEYKIKKNTPSFLEMICPVYITGNKISVAMIRKII